MLHILQETIMHSIKLLPFLFISYIIIEFIEHKASEKLKKALGKSGKYGPVVGSALGIIPQCGFSVTASSLYSSKIITVGTLIAVFLSTSDEAIPVLISHPNNIVPLIKILVIKFFIALIAGFAIDFVLRKINNNFGKSIKEDKEKNEEINIKKEELDIENNKICKHCGQKKYGILISSIKRTLSIFLFIFIVMFILNFAIHSVGEERLSKILMSGSIFQPFICALIGLIPNCASSVVLAELYIAGKISLGAIISGLATGAGLGLAVLFKSNKNIKENIKILITLYLIGALTGFIINIIEMIIC